MGTPVQDHEPVERWGIFERTFTAPIVGNPYTTVEFGTVLRNGNREVRVEGFFDGTAGGKGAGDALFGFRFMPDAEGAWSYKTYSNLPELDGEIGTFECGPPNAGNHGPVKVGPACHLRYEDGTPYVPVGTTCYAWVHQGEPLESTTLSTLQASPFNKLRMCVFPKSYLFNENEPTFPVFEGGPDGSIDFDRPNPAFFHHLENQVERLRAMGIEADIILFHPYDRWGYATMTREQDDRYLKYVVARLAAYRNVWWSLANEYDLMKSKTLADWDRFFRIIQTSDSSQHLRSIHNCRGFYDHGKPWVTHCSIQSSAIDRAGEWRDLYRKPVLFDECRYEGNIHRSWGNITAQEMSHRFWEAACRGAYAGHGETYVHPEHVLWWAKGGVLHGESPARIAFLRSILEEAPEPELEPVTLVRDSPAVGVPGAFYLIYFGASQPAYKELALPGEGPFEIEVIDTWDMKIRKLSGLFSGEARVDLPSKPYIALRIVKKS